MGLREVTGSQKAEAYIYGKGVALFPLLSLSWRFSVSVLYYAFILALVNSFLLDYELCRGRNFCHILCRIELKSSKVLLKPLF